MTMRHAPIPARRMATVYLGLGANLGDREANLCAACQRLRAGGVQLERCSSLYETEPWGVREQPRFLNAVCRASTDLPPRELLALIKRIETGLGRMDGERWGPRPVDVDILLYGEESCATPGLTIPHAQLADRAFVLVPLAEIAPDLRLPGSGRTVRELLDSLGDTSGVIRVGEPICEET